MAKVSWRICSVFATGLSSVSWEQSDGIGRDYEMQQAGKLRRYEAVVIWAVLCTLGTRPRTGGERPVEVKI